MNFLSIFTRNKTEVIELQSKIRQLETEIKFLKEFHFKELALKDKEINLLNQREEIKEKVSNIEPITSKNIDKKELSIRENEIYQKFLKYQCKNYQDLSKVTGLKNNVLRNLVCRIKKKGWEFNFFV